MQTRAEEQKKEGEEMTVEYQTQYVWRR